MNIEKFADMLLKGIKKEEMSDAEVERIKDGLFGITVSDMCLWQLEKSIFLNHAP